MSTPSSADSSSRIPPLPAGTDLAQLAEAWAWASLRLDERTRERAMNAALGLPDWADAGERSTVAHRRRWEEDEMCARFELARRELGLEPPGPPRCEWSSWPVRWRRRFQALLRR